MSDAFRALHEQLFVLPNAWDAASARLLGQRFPAVGTTSLGLAAAAGVPDGVGAAREATMRLATALRERSFMLTVDVEGGFDGIDSYVAELSAEGINLEDGREGVALCPPQEQVEQIAAVRSRCPEVFVNARVDTWWLGIRTEETLDRVRAYVAAGADGVFVPGLPLAEIPSVVAAAGVPLNVLAAPRGPSLQRLREAGVRRVSTGSLLYRHALGHGSAIAAAIAGGEEVAEAPAYDEVDRLAPSEPAQRRR